MQEVKQAFQINLHSLPKGPHQQTDQLSMQRAVERLHEDARTHFADLKLQVESLHKGLESLVVDQRQVVEKLRAEVQQDKDSLREATALAQCNDSNVDTLFQYAADNNGDVEEIYIRIHDLASDVFPADIIVLEPGKLPPERQPLHERLTASEHKQTEQL